MQVLRIAHRTGYRILSILLPDNILATLLRLLVFLKALLAPYFFIAKTSSALMISAIATLLALFIFGFVKGKFTGSTPLKSGIQTVVIGGLTASVAFGLARLIG